MRRGTTKDSPGGRLARRRLCVVMALATSLGIAGCGGHGSTAASSHASTSTTSTTVNSGPLSLPPGVVNALSLPTHILNDVQLRKNVLLTRCESTKHGWRASGSATNPSAARADYAITVFFTTSSATVIGSGVTHVRLAPRAHAAWTASGSFTPAPATSCVLRGVG
jgi:hypothetical protein